MLGYVRYWSPRIMNISEEWFPNLRWICLATEPTPIPKGNIQHPQETWSYLEEKKVQKRSWPRKWGAAACCLRLDLDFRGWIDTPCDLRYIPGFDCFFFRRSSVVRNVGTQFLILVCRNGKMIHQVTETLFGWYVCYLRTWPENGVNQRWNTLKSLETSLGA